MHNLAYIPTTESGMLISLPNCSGAGSVIAMKFPSDFPIFSTPSVPTSSGTVSTACGACPRDRCSSRPTRLLKVWSVPPSSMSARISTESMPCSSG